MTQSQLHQATTIYFIEDGTINSSILLDFVMGSAEETTTPHGVDYVYYIDHPSEEEWHLRQWVAHGSKSILVDSYDNEEEAEEALYDKILLQFYSDDQRITTYYSTHEEAEQALIEEYADEIGVDIDVARSIKRREVIVSDARAKRIAIAAARHKQETEAMAAQYSRIIDAIPGETYNETSARLSDAISTKGLPKPLGAAFHKAVKMARARARAIK